MSRPKPIDRTEPSPGPWTVYEAKHSEKAPPHEFQIRDAKSNVIAITAPYGYMGAPLGHERAANAKALAAAHELLAVVRAELASGRNFGGDGDLYTAARAALDKAGYPRG